MSVRPARARRHKGERRDRRIGPKIGKALESVGNACLFLGGASLMLGRVVGHAPSMALGGGFIVLMLIFYVMSGLFPTARRRVRRMKPLRGKGVTGRNSLAAGTRSPGSDWRRTMVRGLSSSRPWGMRLPW